MNETHLSEELLERIQHKREQEEAEYPDFDGPSDLIEYNVPPVVVQKSETRAPRKHTKKPKQRKPRVSDEEYNKLAKMGYSGVGTPRKHSDNDIIQTLMSVGGNVQKASVELGCNYSSLKRLIRTTPHLKEQCDLARADHIDETLDRVESRLEALARSGNIKAIGMFLKAHGEERGYVERRILKTDPESPLQVVIRRGD